MTIDDRDMAATMAGLATSAPPTLAPGVLVEVGLADRFARVDSPIGPLVVAWNGLGISAVESTPDDASFEAAHAARTGRAAYPAAALPPRPRRAIRTAARRRPPSDGSTSTCAATPTSSATSGARRWRSRAARSGRTAGSPRRSAGRRPSAPSAPRSATTRCRSSCRATASSGPTARSASTRSAVRATSGRSWPPKGSIQRSSRASPGPVSASSARTRPTSSACRPATTRSGSRRATPHALPVAGQRDGERVSGLPGVPTGIRSEPGCRLTPVGHGWARRQ